MKVFNLYFKILRKYYGIILMYVGIFIGILLGVIPKMVQSEEATYTQTQCSFAVFDYDNSELSNAIIQYLQTIHQLEELADDEKETIQDALYEETVHCVIRVKEGFEQAFIQGTAEAYLEVFSIPNTVSAVLFEENLQNYLKIVNTYEKAGFEIKEAIIKSEVIMDTSVKIEMLDTTKVVSEQPIHYFYKYLNWIFIVMCVNSISVVLLSLDNKKVRDRLQSSPYPFLRINFEIILGILTTGFFICSFYILLSIFIFPKEMLKIQGIFYILNAFCTMAVALSITFFVSKVTKEAQVVSLMSNIFGLGMAFLCGVFVPLEFLSEKVIQIAHFFPVYWNVKALEIIERYEVKDTGILFLYLGIQLLFVMAILCMSMIIARRKRMISE